MKRPDDDDDPRPAPDFYGQAIHTARFLRGFTLRETADGSGVSLDRLSRYEHGAIATDLLDFMKIWSYLSSDPPPKRKTRP